MISAFGFLIFFYLKHFVLILAASVLFNLFHAAVITGPFHVMRKIPVNQPSHAVMQVYRGSHGGAQVKNSQYKNQELFHAGVKVYRFFGNDFIKFGKKVTESACGG